MAATGGYVLGRRDLRALLAAVERLHAAASIAGFARVAAEAVEALIRCDVASVTHWSEATGHRVFHTTRWLWTAEQREAAAALLPTHPLVEFLRRRPTFEPVALSDVISDPAWRAHPFYRQVWQPHGIFRLLQCTLRLDGGEIASISLDRRGRDFSPRERALLGATGPHLVAAWRRLTTPAAEAAIGRHGSATFADPQRLTTLGITPREAEVLHWIVDGKQNRDIATILGLSPRTVQKHVENILRRLGVENRHALTVLTLRSLASR